MKQVLNVTEAILEFRTRWVECWNRLMTMCGVKFIAMTTIQSSLSTYPQK